MLETKCFGGKFEMLVTDLTPKEQSSERYLPGTIVSWRDIFDNDAMIPKENFWKLSTP